MSEKKNKPPFYLIDTDADFYRPLGVRLAICIAVGAWAALEIWNGDGFWGIISGAAAVYCVYTLFIAYDPAPKEEPIVRPDDLEEDEGETARAEEGVDALVDRLFYENATWAELIKAIRASAQMDIFSAEKIALSHAGWRRRCNVLMNQEKQCRKHAAYHIKTHGPQALIASVDGRYVVIEPEEAP